jgi:hypothetical protein
MQTCFRPGENFAVNRASKVAQSSDIDNEVNKTGQRRSSSDWLRVPRACSSAISPINQLGDSGDFVFLTVSLLKAKTPG